MSATTDRAADPLPSLALQEHPGCVVCGPANPHGLRVRFEVLPDGSTQGHFACDKAYEGYSGVLHGGIQSALLDGAMLHCLFARGCPAVTMDLSIQFRHPVQTGVPVLVRAQLLEQAGELYMLAGDIQQLGQIRTKARGRFTCAATRR